MRPQGGHICFHAAGTAKWSIHQVTGVSGSSQGTRHPRKMTGTDAHPSPCTAHPVTSLGRKQTKSSLLELMEHSANRAAFTSKSLLGTLAGCPQPTIRRNGYIQHAGLRGTSGPHMKRLRSTSPSLQLPQAFDEGHALDIAQGASQLDDAHVGLQAKEKSAKKRPGSAVTSAYLK